MTSGRETPLRPHLRPGLHIGPPNRGARPVTMPPCPPRSCWPKTRPPSPTPCCTRCAPKASPPSTCCWAAQVLPRLARGGIDLVILDVGLPDASGFEVCRRLREHHALPVIFLTARSDEIDRVLGLELGADDYMAKPFSPRELVARVRARLRRHEGGQARQRGRFEIDADGHRIRYAGHWLELTRYEYALLAELLRRPGAILARAQLLDRVWADALDIRRAHRRHPREDPARQAARAGPCARPDPHPSRAGLLHRGGLNAGEDRAARAAGLLPDRRAGGAAAGQRVRAAGQARRAPGDGGHPGRHRQRAGGTGHATTCWPGGSPTAASRRGCGR